MKIKTVLIIFATTISLSFAQEATMLPVTLAEKSTPAEIVYDSPLGMSFGIWWPNSLSKNGQTWQMKATVIKHRNEGELVTFIIGNFRIVEEELRFVPETTFEVKKGESFTVAGPYSDSNPGGPYVKTFTFTKFENGLITLVSKN